MSNVNLATLQAIAAATAAGTSIYLTAQDGMPLLNHKPPLIDAHMGEKDPNDANKIKVTLTEAGARMATQPEHVAVQAQPITVLTGFVRPPIKRGGGHTGAPAKYPFESLQVGQHFFIANSAVEKGDALKTLSSAVGSANQRFADPVKNADGTVKMVEKTRAKRGEDKKAVKGPDGKNVMEKVMLPEKVSQRKFSAVPVKAGEKYGEWEAPADGAVALRTE